jgi:FtsP/CotA-like multicopper oxidase with cupredoxin domain
MLNASPDFHPMHMHQHTYEVISVNGKKSSGLMKDTLNLTPFGSAEIDFVATNPGPALFHCHQQLHMDYGSMTIIRYV